MTPQRPTRGQVPSSALSPAGAPVTRFAPSPTGRLHLGHAWSALLAHDYARARGGTFLLRIEDIDPGRVRADYVDGIFEDLDWLGLGWDGEVLFQSRRLDLYQAPLDELRARGLLYPCTCTRKAIAAEIAASASAPHGPDGPVYPGTCRPEVEAERAPPASSEPHAWRLNMDAALAAIAGSKPAAPNHDRLRANSALPPVGGGLGGGPAASAAERTSSSASRADLPAADAADPPPSTTRRRVVHPTRGRGLPASLAQNRSTLDWHDDDLLIPADPARFGDVVLARKDAPASYHLAVTIDDAAQGITDIVRGEDLFEATHVHRLLQALLGLPTPRYHHHPLIMGGDGRRLAKRNGAPTIAGLREAGTDPRELVEKLRNGRFPGGYSVSRT